MNAKLFGLSSSAIDGAEYDHVVSVVGIQKHPITDPTYYPDDQIAFADHGVAIDAAPTFSLQYSVLIYLPLPLPTLSIVALTQPRHQLRCIHFPGLETTSLTTALLLRA
jgi:hypothetical protein